MDHPSADESKLAIIKMFPLLGISSKIVTLKSLHRDSLCNIIYNIKKLEATYMSNSEIIAK